MLTKLVDNDTIKLTRVVIYVEVITINEKFHSLDLEKRNRIINAGLKEFSKNGFKKASTNKIVEEADISKGLLYHYFSTKQKLYDYLIEFSIETIIDAIENQLDWEETDFFKRVTSIVMIKFKVLAEYPAAYDFFTMIFKDEGIDKIIEIRQDFSPELYNKIYSYNIDYSKFRSDVDIEKVMQIINWTYEKYGDKIMGDSDGTIKFDEMEADVNEYTAILRKIFYK